jgi:hypothetical protein
MNFKHSTTTLDHEELDLAVARVAINAGERCIRISRAGRPLILNSNGRWEPFHPTSNWAHAGPFIEVERISLRPIGEGWAAGCSDDQGVSTSRAPSPLMAGMRAYITKALGEGTEC